MFITDNTVIIKPKERAFINNIRENRKHSNGDYIVEEEYSEETMRMFKFIMLFICPRAKYLGSIGGVAWLKIPKGAHIRTLDNVNYADVCYNSALLV